MNRNGDPPRIGAWAVTHGDPPEVFVADDELTLTRVLVRDLVLSRPPTTAQDRAELRQLLAEKNYAGAVQLWITLKGEHVDVYPESLKIHSARDLPVELFDAELALDPLFAESD